MEAKSPTFKTNPKGSSMTLAKKAADKADKERQTRKQMLIEYKRDTEKEEWALQNMQRKQIQIDDSLNIKYAKYAESGELGKEIDFKVAEAMELLTKRNDDNDDDEEE